MCKNCFVTLPCTLSKFGEKRIQRQDSHCQILSAHANTHQNNCVGCVTVTSVLQLHPFKVTQKWLSLSTFFLVNWCCVRSMWLALKLDHLDFLDQRTKPHCPLLFALASMPFDLVKTTCFKRSLSVLTHCGSHCFASRFVLLNHAAVLCTLTAS